MILDVGGNVVNPRGDKKTVSWTNTHFIHHDVRAMAGYN